MATKKTATKAAPKKRAKPQPKVIRNLRNLHVSVFPQKRRVELAPRGQRNDLAPLEKGDLSDAGFLADKDVLFEIITQGEADKVTAKQATNIQQARHPALDMIRNDKGERYEDGAVKMEQNSEAQGKVVADLTSEKSRGTTKFDWGVGIQRAAVPGSVDHETTRIPDTVAPEDQAAWRNENAAEQAEIVANARAIVAQADSTELGDEQLDAIARDKALEGPAAGGVLKVTKQPIQRT